MAVETAARATRAPWLINYLLTLDGAISLRIHSLFRPYVPVFILMLLEFSADFRLFFPIAIGVSVFPVAVPFLPFLSRLIFGLILDILVIAVAKLLFRRQRPSYNPSMSAAVSVDHFSFPSGHASRAFFVASLVFLSSASLYSALTHSNHWHGHGNEEKTVQLVIIIVLIWAISTAASRVLLGRHYLLDVLAGVGMGICEGIVAFHFVNCEDYILKLSSLIGYYLPSR